MTWDYDSVSKHETFGSAAQRQYGLSTHLRIWPGGVHLLEWAEKEHIFERPVTGNPGGGAVFEEAERKGSNSVAPTSATPVDSGELNPAIKVLELGSGTGWVGLVLAKNLGSRAQITMTELDAAMLPLRANCTETATALHLDNVFVLGCDWQDYVSAENYRSLGDGEPLADELGSVSLASAADRLLSTHGHDGSHTAPEKSTLQMANFPCEVSRLMPPINLSSESVVLAEPPISSADLETGKNIDLTIRSTAWDFVIGSELAWNMPGATSLPHVFKTLLGRENAARYGHKTTPQVFYAHQPQYSQTAHRVFLQECASLGLILEDVKGEKWQSLHSWIGARPAEIYPDQSICGVSAGNNEKQEQLAADHLEYMDPGGLRANMNHVKQDDDALHFDTSVDDASSDDVDAIYFDALFPEHYNDKFRNLPHFTIYEITAP